jgi:hypothetical protein
MRRMFAFLAAVGLVASLAGPGTVAASARHAEYLALGDSLAFGYNPLVDPAKPARFIGYTDFVAVVVRDTLTNASCPGETSSHFIDLAGSDRGCGTFRSAYRLHVAYPGTQLAFADAFLATHPNTQLVTIDIGANDLNVLVDSCGGRGNVPCILNGLPGMLLTLGSNLSTIYGHLRTVDGYQGKLVALTFPSLDYADPILTGVVQQLDLVVATVTLAWGGIVADGFGPWASASAAFGGDTCAAGLRVVTSTTPRTCDDHPSLLGHALLAWAIVRALHSA